MAFVTLNRIERRRMTVFLTCLVVAVLTWLFIALSGKYKYRVDTRITYINPPENKAYHPLQDDSVSLEVEGSGWHLLFSRLRLNPQSVEVNLRSLNSRNYLVFSNQLNDLNKQFDSNQRVISVSPDTLFFDFSKRIVKKVPIRLVSDLAFKKNYGISNDIKLTPAQVTVNGAAEDLKKITYWSTLPLKRQDISVDLTAKVGIAPPGQNNIDVYPQSVKVEIPVDIFTEKVIEVPVEVLNAKGLSVKLLPEKVKVTIFCALENYPSIDRESFRAAVDLKDWLERGATQLPVSFRKFPPFCRLIKTEPQVVDFFVKR
ncbi:hypothetical protein DDR33_15305 [Pararcticibacter amylolyticus]|uniref:YbbR-like domain-containing protein n=2 Tax=Pararcticibacter amylolyticus TaxID=2173175 RepID=A0A2U2PEE9_9SPHI|nr:hypothetical protein DDR33_15305 [Pararcticibacter amylolyticus]